jgi:enoyl-CoA hydratase/carnithine racemase
MSDEPVLFERRDPGIALITLNRPEQLNAWTGAMGARYFQLLDQCAADPAVKVIVVTGAGRGFCSGADMNDLAAMGSASGSTGAESAASGRPQWHTTTIPKPVIAAINGACAGMGMAQALLCDIRFAAAGAKFTTAFSRRGLIAEWGLSWALPRLVGTARANDLLFSGRTFLAEEAAAMGVVNAVVPADQLLAYTFAYAEDLALHSSPTSMAVIKQQVIRSFDQHLVEAHDEAVELMKASILRPDFKEGVASFLQKRLPNFTPVDPTA